MARDHAHADPVIEGRHGDMISAVCIGGPLALEIRKAAWGSLLLQVEIKSDPPDCFVAVSYIPHYVTLFYRLLDFEWRSPAHAERPGIRRRRLFWVWHMLSNAEANKLIAAYLGLATTPR